MKRQELDATSAKCIFTGRGDNDPVTKNVFVARSAHVVETSPVDLAYVGSLMEETSFMKGEGRRAHDSMLPASPPFYPLLNEAADLPSLLALPDSPGRGIL